MARTVKAPVATRAAEAAGKAETPKSRAQALSALALETLEAILRGGGSDAAKIAAAREVLDRAYGKSKADEKPAPPKRLTVVIRRFGDAGAKADEEDH